MEVIDINKFRENALSENLCSEYTGKWNKSLSRKALVDLALEVKGADYLCDSIAKGWGVSPEYISDKFDMFINGKYIAKFQGYDSKMYCNYDGQVESNTTILILINSNVKLNIPEHTISEIYCTGKCNISVFGDGECIFVCYGDEGNVIINNESNVRIKRIQKNKRDEYPSNI